MSSPTLPILTAAPSAILATAASSTDRRPLYRHFSRPCDKCGVRHSELACPVTESLQPASRIDCFTQTDPTPPCCHHQCTDDSAAQPADPQPQPADPQPQPAAPQPRQPRSRVVRSRKSSFTDYLPLIRKYEAVLQKQKDDPHSTLTDLCLGIVSYNSFCLQGDQTHCGAVHRRSWYLPGNLLQAEIRSGEVPQTADEGLQRCPLNHRLGRV